MSEICGYCESLTEDVEIPVWIGDLTEVAFYVCETCEDELSGGIND